MVDDLSDVWKELRALKAEVRQQRTATPFENASVTNGSVRFIGGLLRVEAGGRVEIVGTLHVEGTTQFVGPVTISGSLDITGDTTITGDLSIEGATSVIGPLTIDGDTTVTGQFDVDGPWELNGNGDITGDVGLQGSMSVTGGGSIDVGSNVTIDPANGGRVVIDGSSGPTVLSNSQIAFDNGSAIQSGGTGILIATPGDVHLSGGDGAIIGGLSDLPQGTNAKYVVATTNGRLYTSSGVGGGGGTPTPGEDLGNFQWPFSLSTVTSEYGPRTSPYTGFHEGIDFGIAPAVAGAPIIAAGDGTVAVSTFASGWGNHVRITHSISAGNVSTLYAHMNATPLVSVGDPVSKGDVIGYVGNTGNSFGAHLHFETWMSTSYGSHVNPRDFMAAYGPS